MQILHNRIGSIVTFEFLNVILETSVRCSIRVFYSNSTVRTGTFELLDRESYLENWI